MTNTMNLKEAWGNLTCSYTLIWGPGPHPWRKRGPRCHFRPFVELIFPHETDLKHVRDLQRSPHAWDSGFVMKEPPVRCWETPKWCQINLWSMAWRIAGTDASVSASCVAGARFGTRIHRWLGSAGGVFQLLWKCGNLFVCVFNRQAIADSLAEQQTRQTTSSSRQAAAPKKAGGKDSDCKWASQFIGQRPSSRVAQKRWKPQPVSSQLWGSPAAANFLWDAHSWHSY